MFPKRPHGFIHLLLQLFNKSASQQGLILFDTRDTSTGRGVQQALGRSRETIGIQPMSTSFFKWAKPGLFLFIFVLFT